MKLFLEIEEPFGNLGGSKPVQDLPESPQNPQTRTKPSHTHTCACTHAPSADGRKPWPACSILQPRDWQTQTSRVKNSGNPRPPCCWDSAPHFHQLSFPKQKCASLYTAAGVRGRIRSRHLVSALVRREITFVQGLEIRL